VLPRIHEPTLLPPVHVVNIGAEADVTNASLRVNQKTCSEPAANPSPAPHWHPHHLTGQVAPPHSCMSRATEKRSD
jgi:hypothetical protein